MELKTAKVNIRQIIDVKKEEILEALDLDPNEWELYGIYGTGRHEDCIRFEIRERVPETPCQYNKEDLTFVTAEKFGV